MGHIYTNFPCAPHLFLWLADDNVLVPLPALLADYSTAVRKDRYANNRVRE